MAVAVLVYFVNLFVFVYNILLLIRVVMSWFNPNPTGGLGGLIFDLTEPVLVPIRRMLPRSQMLDFSPLIAFVLLQVIAELINRVVGG